MPENLRNDKGPEFIAYCIQDWLKAQEIKTLYIKPGSPWENGHIESFHIRGGIVSTSSFGHGDAIMSDDNDTAGRVHRKRYGRSDKANARENRNPEFQEGYAKGIESLAYDPIKIVAVERRIRQQVGDDRGAGFDEWQRGLWASRSQFAAMGIRPKRKNK